MSYDKYTTRRQSRGEALQDNLTTVSIAIFLFYIIKGFFKVLACPFKYFFQSQDSLDEKVLEIARDKKKSRRERNENFLSSSYAKGLLNDPQWVSDFKAGKIQDSELNWAPDVYATDGVNEHFLNYLEIQMALLKDFSSRMAFIKTIREYYPEFTPDPEYIPAEIKLIRNKLQEKNLREEFIQLVKDSGLSSWVAGLFLKANHSMQELRERIEFYKAGKALGYEDHIIYGLERINNPKIIVEALGLPNVKQLVETVRATINENSELFFLPGYILLDMSTGKIDAESLNKISMAWDLHYGKIMYTMLDLATIYRNKRAARDAGVSLPKGTKECPVEDDLWVLPELEKEYVLTAERKCRAQIKEGVSW